MTETIIRTKGEARQKAIEWQQWASRKNLYYSELAAWQKYFEYLGKRFGLIREFKENGIL